MLWINELRHTAATAATKAERKGLRAMTALAPGRGSTNMQQSASNRRHARNAQHNGGKAEHNDNRPTDKTTNRAESKVKRFV